MRQKVALLARLRRLVSARKAQPTALDARTAYDLWSESYDNTTGNALLYSEERVIRPMLESLPITGLNILDAGCGTGRYLSHLLARNPRILVGFDFSPKMLMQAKKKFSTGSAPLLVQASFDGLPFREGSFDFLLSTLAVDHGPSLDATIRELSRVVRPGGTLLLSCFHPFASLTGWKRTFSAKSRWYSVSYVPYKIADYLNAFLSSGLAIARVEEPAIDESVLHLYVTMGKEDFYMRSKGHPLSLIFLLEKKT
ncbi:MAG: methyltransferase domain-containing protein [Ignavibacteriales bacterium]|nr:methyltransferase domain-containing protein [Ignavibacteriales bacterium]